MVLFGRLGQRWIALLGLVAVPSYAELAGLAAADVERYTQAANASTPTRVKLFHLAFDAAVSSFSVHPITFGTQVTTRPVCVDDRVCSMAWRAGLWLGRPSRAADRRMRPTEDAAEPARP